MITAVRAEGKQLIKEKKEWNDEKEGNTIIDVITYLRHLFNNEVQ